LNDRTIAGTEMPRPNIGKMVRRNAGISNLCKVCRQSETSWLRQKGSDFPEICLRLNFLAHSESKF
jgi:hypothetical protein